MIIWEDTEKMNMTTQRTIVVDTKPYDERRLFARKNFVLGGNYGEHKKVRKQGGV